MIAETRALDSFQNVSLPLHAFASLYGTLPKQVTVVSHEFKRARFEELHFPLLKAGEYAGVEFKFTGQDPPYMREGNEEYNAVKAHIVRDLERKNGFEMWLRDPKGEGGEVVEKRRARDVWGVQFPLVEAVRREAGRFTEVE